MPPLPAERPTPPEVKFGNFRPFNAIDQFILATLKEQKRIPRPVCDDWDFLRRSSLDLVGVVPTAADVAMFMKWRDKDRRAKWIDTLLSQPQYADHWTAFWGDLLRERDNLRGMPRDAFRQYIHASLKENKPFDQWTREMISATGHAEDNPAVAFILGDEADPDMLTVAVSQVFLGVQLKCAQCHNHPFDWWTQDDFKGMAGFFGGAQRRVYRRDTYNRRDRVVDIPYFEVLERPRRAHGVFLTGMTSDKGVGREGLADLVTRRDNPYFARVTVNRLWQKMFGAALVNPVDALGPRNPASHPELLDWLALEFIDSGYDLKHMLRLIASSRTYQQTSDETVANYVPPRPGDGELEDTVRGSLFDAMPLRRMTAEQMYDSILVATGRYLPDNRRFEPSIMQRYPPRQGGFLRTFGASDRMTLLPRDAAATIQQSLALLNGEDVNEAVKIHSDHPLQQWRRQGYSTDQIIEALFVQFLTRRPTPQERQWATEFVGLGRDDKLWEDLQWALVNSREFQFIR